MINGNIVGSVNTPTSTSAGGVWGLREQVLARYGDEWPSTVPLSYVSSTSSGSAGSTWNFTPGQSTCVVVGICAIAFVGNGSPILSAATFNGANMTIIKDKFLTNLEPNGSTQSVFSWLLGITGTFTAGTSYPIVTTITNTPSGQAVAGAAMSFAGPVTGFGTASTAGGNVVPSSTAAASVTVTSQYPTSLIGFGARQANSPALVGGTVQQQVAAGANVRVHMSQVDVASSQTFSTTGGAVAGFALTR